MDMTGERRIPAPRQKVWDALNDPAVLKAAIPGCKTLEKTSDSDMKATAGGQDRPDLGAVHRQGAAARPRPAHLLPHRRGGPGRRRRVRQWRRHGPPVRRWPFTLLQYEVKAQVGGKIAQLGARLIDATAKQMADQFFDRFSAEVSGPRRTRRRWPADRRHPALATPAGSQAPVAINMLAMIPKEPYGYPLVFWIGSVVFLAIFVLIFGSYVF